MSSATDFQSPNPRCYTHAAVIKLFKPPVNLETVRKTWNVAFRCKLFGNPLDSNFEQANIAPVTLPGFADGGGTCTVRMHKKLHRVLVKAFTEIQNLGLSYKLWHINEKAQYCFRYTDNAVDKLNGLAEYAGISGNKKVEFAKRDRERGLAHKVVAGKPKFEMLSRHSWGIAIDINAATNPLKTGGLFDMPYAIVKVMLLNGFHWGGYYEHDRHDYMHFEYGLDTIADVRADDPAMVDFPLGHNEQRQSPLKFFARAEAQPGGFFPLGTHQNLHGGIHLEAKSTSAAALQPVHSILPGYVVAARIVDTDKAGGDKAMLDEVTGGQTLGFVLVRHELKDPAVAAQAPAAGESAAAASPPPATAESGTADSAPSPTGGGDQKKEAPKPSILHSLYMNLAVPSWGRRLELPAIKKDHPASFLDVPWLSQFLKMQFGSVVDLEPNSSSFGQTFWSRTECSASSSEYEVFERDKLTARVDGVRRAFFRATPDECRNAINAFRDGAIVTFDTPVFPITSGEDIGLLSPGSSSSSRHLHWEVFSVAGEQNGVETVLKKAQEVFQISLIKTKEADGKEDNFLEMPKAGTGAGTNEVQKVLGDSGEPVVRSLVDEAYAEPLMAYMNDENFTPPGTRTRCPRTYPLELTLKNVNKYKGEPEGGFLVEVQFLADGVALGPAEPTRVLNLSQSRAQLILDVPVDADEVQLWSPHVFIDPIEPPTPKAGQEARQAARIKLFKDVVPHKFRNLVLEHVDEWTPSGLEKAVKARNALGRLHALLPQVPDYKFSDSDLKKVLDGLKPLSWWARPDLKSDPFGEAPFRGTDGGSLFGDGEHVLPSDARIVNLHPVTAVWLMDMLLEAKKLDCVNSWPNSPLRKADDDRSPPFLGLPLASAPRVGAKSFPVLVQHGFGTGEPEITFTLTSAKGKKLELGGSAQREGVAYLSLPFPAWGSWTLSASDPKGDLSPKETLNTKVDVPRPELFSTTFDLSLRGKPQTNKKSKNAELPPPATGVFIAKKGCPTELAGYVTFDCWKVPRSETLNTEMPALQPQVAIPVRAKRQDEDGERTAGGLKFKAGFIVGTVKGKGKGQPNPPVTRSFKFLEFVKGPGKKKIFEDGVEKFRLAVALANRLQSLHDLCLDKELGVALRLVLTKLAAEGTEIDVIPLSKKRSDLDTIAERAGKLPASPFFEHKIVDGPEPVFRLTYKPDTDAGTLDFEFDPCVALGHAVAELLPEDDDSRLYVRPRFIAPNGGHMVLNVGTDEEGGDGSVQLSAQAIRDAACDKDFLELEADEFFPPIERMAFGEMTCKLDKDHVVTEVPLFGPAALWKAAGPCIRMSVGDTDAVAGTIRGKTLVHDWELVKTKKQKRRPNPDLWFKTLAFKTEFHNPEALTAMPPSVSGSIKLEPKLVSLDWTVESGRIAIRGTSSAILTCAQLGIEIECLSEAGQWKPDKATPKIQYAHSDQRHFGRCAADGSFLAWIALKHFSSAGQRRFKWVYKLADTNTRSHEELKETGRVTEADTSAAPKLLEILSKPMMVTETASTKKGRTFEVSKL